MLLDIIYNVERLVQLLNDIPAIGSCVKRLRICSWWTNGGNVVERAEEWATTAAALQEPTVQNTLSGLGSSLYHLRLDDPNTSLSLLRALPAWSPFKTLSILHLNVHHFFLSPFLLEPLSTLPFLSTLSLAVDLTLEDPQDLDDNLWDDYLDMQDYEQRGPPELVNSSIRTLNINLMDERLRSFPLFPPFQRLTLDASFLTPSLTSSTRWIDDSILSSPLTVLDLCPGSFPSIPVLLTLLDPSVVPTLCQFRLNGLLFHVDNRESRIEPDLGTLSSSPSSSPPAPLPPFAYNMAKAYLAAFPTTEDPSSPIPPAARLLGVSDWMEFSSSWTVPRWANDLVPSTVRDVLDMLREHRDGPTKAAQVIQQLERALVAHEEIEAAVEAHERRG
ncbi:hypothetical protein JCM8547_000811 [Rhodosporidiobolus lusitaniae]